MISRFCSVVFRSVEMCLAVAVSGEHRGLFVHRGSDQVGLASVAVPAGGGAVRVHSPCTGLLRAQACLFGIAS
jgi:hypothetical protein